MWIFYLIGFQGIAFLSASMEHVTWLEGFLALMVYVLCNLGVYLSLRKDDPSVSDPIAVMGLLAFPAALSLGYAFASAWHFGDHFEWGLRIGWLVVEFAGMLYGSTFAFRRTDNTKEILGFSMFPLASIAWKHWSDRTCGTSSCS